MGLCVFVEKGREIPFVMNLGLLQYLYSDMNRVRQNRRPAVGQLVEKYLETNDECDVNEIIHTDVYIKTNEHVQASILENMMEKSNWYRNCAIAGLVILCSFLFLVYSHYWFSFAIFALGGVDKLIQNMWLLFSWFSGGSSSGLGLLATHKTSVVARGVLGRLNTSAAVRSIPMAPLVMSFLTVAYLVVFEVNWEPEMVTPYCEKTKDPKMDDKWKYKVINKGVGCQQARETKVQVLGPIISKDWALAPTSCFHSCMRAFLGRQAAAFDEILM
jgi:TRAP-type C4-dicarboxylate transport system permease small subunit